MSERPQVKYVGSALPGIAETVNIFNTTLTGVRGFLSNARASRFETSLQNDQTGTLKAYWSDDFGVTWNRYNDTAVTIPAAGLSSGPFDYLVDGYKDWKLDFLCGATAQTTFIVNSTLTCGDRAAAT